MPITSNYDSDALYNNSRQPLMIGCSGGGGHNTAIKGIKGFLAENYAEQIQFPEYQARLFDKDLDSYSRKQIKVGTSIMHTFYVGGPIRNVVRLTPLPVFPDINDIETEINKLSAEEKKMGKRCYIDMLLDVYPAGYESAAIWNVLQRADEIAQLKKLIDLQAMSDKRNYDNVKEYYLNQLKANASTSPYTEIISTQAMALPALCDAVREYNEWLDQEKLNSNPPKVVIHQYLTDLPTKGAVHFFNSLSKLTPDQQKQMKLSGVGMNDHIMNHFFPNGTGFAGLYNIPANQNPMVRPGFKDPTLDNSQKFNTDISITLKDYQYDQVNKTWNKTADAQHVIKAGEKIASIMLGSQAGADTTEYILPLFESGVDKIFVFGGQQNTVISDKIEKIIASNPLYQSKIIRLGNQDDIHIAPLMSRSNVVVIRGGGLSVMEQMAMNHNSEQTVLIHHANSSEEDLSSGISWEDENVNALITDLNCRRVYARKTSPDRAKRHLLEAELFRAVRAAHGDVDINSRVKLIQKLPENKLREFVDNLKKTNWPYQLDHYFSEYEKKAAPIISNLSDSCKKCKKNIYEHIKAQLNAEQGDWKKLYERVDKDIQCFALSDYIMEQREYDVDSVVHDFMNGTFEESKISSEFKKMLNSYRIITEFTRILNNKEGTATKKLDEFIVKYHDADTNTYLLSSTDNFIQRIIKEIEYQLSKVTVLKPIEFFFTPEQTLRKQVDELKSEDHKGNNLPGLIR